MASPNPFSRLLGQEPTTGTLAVLQPADNLDAPIKLTLTGANLTETSYECISYDRAEDKDSVSILVDGEDQDIPKALESALRTFRRKEKPRTLWADLLVGRTDEERSAHATSIRQILENADKTLCWLGPDKSSTAKAFDTIQEMGKRWSQACLHVELSQDTSLSRITAEQMNGIREQLNCPFDDLNSFDFDHWNVIYDIFGAQYWKSVQCISEIVLAKLAIVVCGRSNIRWPNYICASRALPFFQSKFFKVPLLPHVMKGFEIVHSIEIAERRRRLGKPLELFPMIQTARDCGGKDPREYVFSMFRIASPSARIKSHKQGPQPLPTVDYTKSATEVFTEAARYTVLERQDLMIWYAERPSCGKRLKNLPSWVPDFSANHVKSTDFNPHNNLRIWWDIISPTKPITVSEDNALHVQAYALDRVTYVSPIFDNGNCTRLCAGEFQKLPAPAFETVDARNERYWRTLILNIAGHGPVLRRNAIPTAALGASFQSLVAQELVLKFLGCTPDRLQSSEIQARIRDSPDLQVLLSRCGQGHKYEELLKKHAIGRRFFRTAGGRFGMTAIEDVGRVDDNLCDEDEAKSLRPAAGDHSKGVDFGHVLSNPIGQMLMSGFQEFLAERDPRAAQFAAHLVRGDMPGQDDQQAPKGGVADGDIVVACVGGFFPYVLRPRSGDGDVDGAPTPSSSPLASSDSTYEFVGDCYLHGSMDGEDFQITGADGRKFFRNDAAKLVDITIV